MAESRAFLRSVYPRDIQLKLGDFVARNLDTMHRAHTNAIFVTVRNPHLRGEFAVPRELAFSTPMYLLKDAWIGFESGKKDVPEGAIFAAHAKWVETAKNRHLEGGQKCPVCLRDLKTEDDLYTTETCAHTFHVECFAKWIAHRTSCNILMQEFPHPCMPLCAPGTSICPLCSV